MVEVTINTIKELPTDKKVGIESNIIAVLAEHAQEAPQFRYDSMYLGDARTVLIFDGLPTDKSWREWEEIFEERFPATDYEIVIS